MGFDVVTIGSATVDVFVHPADTEIEQHKDHLDVCYHIGEKVLIDDLVVDTGGGGTNTAVAFARLGFKTAWLGCLGDDHNALLVKDALKKEHVTTIGPTVKGMTGYSVIMVGLRHDRAILAFKGVNDSLTTIPALNTKWLYCSSMMGRSFDTLVKVVQKAKKKGIRYAFNPSMYIAKKGVAALRPLLQDCDLLIMNKEEASALLNSLPDVNYMLKNLQQLAKIVVITDGPVGAYATDGLWNYTIRPRPIKVIETTGAGDSFASGVVAGLMMGEDVATALRYGMAESESVIQAVGAKNVLLKKPALLRQSKRYYVHQVKV